MKNYQTEYVSVAYHEDLDLVQTKWFKNTLHEDYRDVFEKVLAIGSAHQCLSWLFDQRDKTGVSLPQDLQWLNETFIPHAVQVMGKKGGNIAIILSKSIFAQLSAKRIAQDNEALIKQQLFEIQYFEEETQAIAWLKEASKKL